MLMKMYLNLIHYEIIHGKLACYSKNEITIDDIALKKLGYEKKINQTIK